MLNKHLIIGYYGENFGDNMMLKSLVELYKKNDYDYSILTYSNLKDSKLIEFVGKDKINLINYKNLSKEIKDCSNVVWGGGTCFFDKKGIGGFKYMLISKFIFNKKINYFSIGIDELKSLKVKIILFLTCLISESIFVRDVKSLKRVNDYTFSWFKNKIYKTFDLVYLNQYNPSPKKNYNSDILIAYRNIDEYFANSKEILNEILYEVTNNIKSFDTKINILVVDPSVDLLNSERIFKELKNKGFKCKLLNNLNYAENCKYIKASKFIITGRLHVGFIALIYNIPFSILNYSSKIEAFTQENFINNYLVNFNNLENLFILENKNKSITIKQIIHKNKNINIEFKRLLSPKIFNLKF